MTVLYLHAVALPGKTANGIFNTQLSEHRGRVAVITGPASGRPPAQPLCGFLDSRSRWLLGSVIAV